MNPEESSCSTSAWKPGPSEPKSPFPCVDIIVERSGEVLLIERVNPPYGYALPGGFVDYGESLEQAAARELQEETGLQPVWLEQFKAYSDPKRDPRLHTLSVVFVAQVKGTPKAQDDAKALDFFPLHSLPTLCFDHGQILSDYTEAKVKGLFQAFQGRQVGRLSEMTTQTKGQLISLAKQAITYFMNHGTPKLADASVLPDEALLYVQPYGVFVTLEVDGSLRGCIGSLENTSKPLYDLVWSMAIQSAFFDPRFQPLDEKELPKLTVEISVLTPPKSAKDLTSIHPGKHGLILESGPQRGLLLPQVAEELHLDSHGFLEAVSLKAGLAKDAWKSFESKIARFEAYVIKDEQNP